MPRKRGRGEGSIDKMPDGRWRARVSLGIGSDGKRKRKAIYGETRAEVQKKLRAAHTANDLGQLPTPNRTTVAEYLDFWIDHISKAGESTKGRYRGDIRKHIKPVIGSTRLQQLTGLHIDSVISTAVGNGLSPRSQQHIFTTLNRSLNDAVKRDLIGFNPCSKSDKPRVPKRKHNVWTAEECQAFLTHVKGHRWFALFTIAMFTGMRQGESLALSWSDIDWENNRIRISRTLTDHKGKAVIGETTKTEAGERFIHVPPYVMDALDSHRARMIVDGHPTQGKSLVFVNHAGNIISRHNLLQRTFKPLCRKANVPVIVWHEMRHTTATLLLESGVPINNVSDLLGHASSVVTATIYAHATKTGMEKVAAMAADLFAPTENGVQNG
ncbi:MAG: site-specific integrase, partial [Planctomycetaceae bacterium]|nr:site-specific integrase [Planctomycetaceae bacterium]